MAHSDGGVKKYLQQRKRIKATRQLSALLLYATKNKRDYKNIIFNLYNDKKSLNNMARQARLNADLHSSKHYAESVLDVYKHAIESKKGPFGLISDIIEKVKK